MQGYKCLIRPLLESASSSRGLHQEYLRDKLENMQSGEGDKQELICHIKVILVVHFNHTDISVFVMLLLCHYIMLIIC